MVEIDLCGYDEKYKDSIEALERSSLAERNKALIKAFLDDCSIGWGGKKLGLPRLIKNLYHLRLIAVYCRRCGLPLNEKAKKYDTLVDDLIEKIILDPELRQLLREKLLEIKTGGENEA